VADGRRGLKASSPTTEPPTRRPWPSSPLDALVAHLRSPTEQRKRSRSTNLLERTFVEVRRRTKVIGRFPGETSALSLISAVLELSSRGWRGVVMTPRSVTEIERLRRRQRTTSTEEVAAAKHPPRADAKPEHLPLLSVK
jgi:putative transposase